MTDMTDETVNRPHVRAYEGNGFLPSYPSCVMELFLRIYKTGDDTSRKERCRHPDHTAT